MSSQVNPFVDLRKALELIRKVLGSGVFESILLTNLRLCESCLAFLLTYEICISKSYCESPSVKRVFIEDWFENPDLFDMESFYERLSPVQSKNDTASE